MYTWWDKLQFNNDIFNNLSKIYDSIISGDKENLKFMHDAML